MPTDSEQHSQQPTLKKQIKLVNKHGIHVRTAALISDLCESFDAEILISSPHATSDGTDMMRLLLLQAAHGTILEVEISGTDAQVALQGVSNLIENGFNLPEERLD